MPFQSQTHSQTLPCTSRRPHGFAGRLPAHGDYPAALRRRPDCPAFTALTITGGRDIRIRVIIVVETRIGEFGISPDLLCFEITETSVVRNLERAQRCIRLLRKLGCGVALDDFGTGYCSFAYLKDLPVHYIKVDGTFVRDLLVNPLSESIIASMTGIPKPSQKEGKTKVSAAL